MFDRLSAWCLMQASFLCRTRAGVFLFTERFQVKFTTPPGVTGVVQLCLEPGCEVGLVSVESFTEFLMAMSDGSCLCRSLYTSLVFLSPSLKVCLFFPEINRLLITAAIKKNPENRVQFLFVLLVKNSRWG